MRAIVADALRGGALGFLHRSRRVRRRRRRTSGAVDDRVAGRSGSADARHRRSRTRHRAHRARVTTTNGCTTSSARSGGTSTGRRSSPIPRGRRHARRTAPSWRLTLHGRAQGADVWAQVTCRPIRQLVTLRDPAPFSTVPAFAEVLADRARASARAVCRPRRGGRAPARSSRRRRSRCCWDKYVVAESDRHPELLGRSVRSLAEARAVRTVRRVVRCSRSTTTWRRDFRSPSPTMIPTAVAELLTGEGCILGLSDAGAHVSQICDAVLPHGLPRPLGA